MGVLTQSLALVMFSGITSQISSQFLSLELLPRCCQLSLSLLEEFYWRLELEVPPPSMLNNSSRRDISDGTLLEYLATAIGFQELGQRTSNAKSELLGDTMMAAIGKWLDNNKSPGRKVKQIDNRGSNFYVALYWAEELAAKDAAWAPLAKALADNEATIVKELEDCQGPACDVGGYYKVDPAKAEVAMRPSKIFNDLMDKY